MAMTKWTPHWYCVRCLDNWDYDVIKAIHSRQVAYEKKKACEHCDHYGTALFVHENFSDRMRPAALPEAETETRELPATTLRLLT